MTDNQEKEFLAKAVSRRNLLKGAAAAGVGSLALGSTGALAANVIFTPNAPGGPNVDSNRTIFTIARTAERLAVTLYTNGVNNAAKLGITGANLDQLKSALIEEQLHELFFAANGGDVLTSTFSFPDGPSTFTDLSKFITAQQQLEGAFDSAFIAAVEEFAITGQATLARIAAQIAMIESEHRALGRNIGGLQPADNWTYAPKLVPTVGAAPAVLASAGYLSPTSGNSFTYRQADFTSPLLSAVYAQVMYKDGPFAVSS